MFGGNFQAWKLNTVGDYASFILYVLVGIFIFWLAVRWLNGQRTHERALSRVVKRLRKYCGPCEILTAETGLADLNLNVSRGMNGIDALLIDRAGIALIKVYEWGLKIYGGPDTQTWRREDSKRREEFENPLFELRRAAKGVKKILKEAMPEGASLENLNITPLVVFADNYAQPEIIIGRDSCSVTYQDLKKWGRARRKNSGQSQQFDPGKILAALRGYAA